MSHRFTLKHFSNPATLKSIHTPLLHKLLGPYRNFLSGRDLDVRDSSAIDYDRLASILMSPGEDTPQPLMDALYFIDEMSHDECYEDMMDKAREFGVSLDDVADATAADLAVLLWLKSPHVLETLHAEGSITTTKTFVSFFSNANVLPRYPADGPHLINAIEHDLNEWFSRRKHGRAVKIFRIDRDDKIWFLIRHGKPYKRIGILNNDTPSRFFFRPEEFDVLFYTPMQGEIQVHANSETVKKKYCEVFGRHLFSDATFFDQNRCGKYTLEPLRSEGRGSLCCSDVPGLERICLSELHWRSDSGQTHITVHKADDIFASLTFEDACIPNDVLLMRAKFRVKFKSSRTPRMVILQVPNRATFNRDSDELLVMEWLRNRGFVQNTAPQEVTDEQAA